MARKLARLRNKIADLPEEFGFRKEDSHWVIPTIQHQPKGGGFLEQHFDPLEPDNCVVSLFLTSRGTDFDEGGLIVEDEGKMVDLESHIGIGDLFIFRPNITHGVAPVDPSQDPDFSTTKGRWRMAAVLNPAIR